MKRFFSRLSRHFFFVYNKFKVVSTICTLTWRVNNYVSRQGKGIRRRNKGINVEESCYHSINQLTVNIDTSFYFEEPHFIALSS